MDPTPRSQATDGTTRYLCAAAHLDEEFCDKAIAEFLVEPVRAIPPSPGVDSTAVLREAVAAQTRRRIRDGLLLALLLLLTWINLTAVIFWAVVVAVSAGLLAAVSGRNRNMIADLVALLAAGAGPSRHMVAGTAQLWAASAGPKRRTLALAVVLIGVIFAPFFLLMSVLQSAIADVPRVSAIPALPTGSISLTLLISGLMLVVLIVDEFTVTKLKTGSFRRDRFDPDAGRVSSGWERLVRSLGHNSFRAELARVARSEESSQAAGQADVVMYRGYNGGLKR